MERIDNPAIDNPADTGGELIAASRVSGTSVCDTAGLRLGSVHDMMVDKASGKVRYAVLSFGGFLGIGETYHPVPWSQLQYDAGQNGYIINIDRKRLEGAPTCSASEIAAWDGRRDRDINAYYGI